MAQTLSQMLGENPVVGCTHDRGDGAVHLFTCPTDEDVRRGIIGIPNSSRTEVEVQQLKDDFNEYRDWSYGLGLVAMKGDDDPATVTAVIVCFDCHNEAPTWRQRRREQANRAQLARQTVVLARDELIGSDVDLLECPVCDELFDAEEAVPIRVCPMESCMVDTFDGSDGRNCTECNRPFTRKVADLGHCECVDSWGEDTGDAQSFERTS